LHSFLSETAPQETDTLEKGSLKNTSASQNYRTAIVGRRELRLAVGTLKAQIYYVAELP